MMQSPTRRIKAILLEYLPIVAGAAISTFGVYNIHSQSGTTEGGIIGLTLLLNHWLGIPQGVISVVLDALCYLVGYKFLGKEFLKYSIVATVSVGLFYSLYGLFPPVLPSLASQPLIAALLGGCFVGVGVGLVVRKGAAAGGDDALALVMSHVFKWRIALCYLFTDVVVLAMSLSYIPIGRIAFSLVTVTVSSIIIDRIQGMGKKSGPQKEAERHKSVAEEGVEARSAKGGS